MDRREVEVETLSRGDKCWYRCQEWEIDNEGQRYIRLVNNRANDYVECNTLVEVDNQ